MAVTGDVRIRVTAEDNASGKLSKVRNETKKLGEESKKATGKLTSLQGGLGALQGALIGAGVVALGHTVLNLMELGVQAKRAETALAAFAGGAGKAEDALIAVQNAAGGAISRMDAAFMATKLFSMGLAKTSDEAANLTDIAVTLGATMGKGPTEAFQDFTLLLANQSILRLDNFGISGARVRKRIQELQSATKGLSREQAFLTAVMEIGAEKLDALDAEGFQAASSLDILKARVDDAKVSVGTWLADGLLPWLDGIRAVNQAVQEQQNRLIMAAPSYEAYRQAWYNNSGAAGTFVAAVSEAEYWATKMAETGMGVAGQNAIYEGSLRGIAGAAGTAAEKVAALVVQTGELTRMQLGQEAMQNLDQALNEGKIAQEDYDRAARVVMSGLLQMDADAIEAQFSMRDLNSQFQSGQVDLGMYVGLMGNLADAIEALPDEKIIHIRVQREGLDDHGNIPEFQHGGSFIVGGRSGVDKNLVMFKASRGEQVTVTPQQSVVNNRNLNVGTLNAAQDPRSLKPVLNDWLSGRM